MRYSGPIWLGLLHFLDMYAIIHQDMDLRLRVSTKTVAELPEKN